MKRFLVCGFALLVVCLPGWAFSCPLCFGSSPFSRGLYWAFFVLLPVPFLLIGSLGWWIYRQTGNDGKTDGAGKK